MAGRAPELLNQVEAMHVSIQLTASYRLLQSLLNLVSCGPTQMMISRTTLLVLGMAVAVLRAEELLAPTDSHMSEALRSSINKVVIVPGESPANQAITGSIKPLPRKSKIRLKQ